MLQKEGFSPKARDRCNVKGYSMLNNNNIRSLGFYVHLISRNNKNTIIRIIRLVDRIEAPLIVMAFFPDDMKLYAIDNRLGVIMFLI